ncbi:allantoate amidohydrolase [Pseudonocardia halophobica]|uniref:allantoate amidohydrolase n=1 Tax=Pseudonocardia halophobica TaxID=29401 RepID=UPI003D8C66F8
MTEFETLWSEIAGIGRAGRPGGYRRFAWTDPDLALRQWFVDCAGRRGMSTEQDRNGNLWAWWFPPGWAGDPRAAFVTGSHLDSVPDGGAFDGPLGVVSAFAAVAQLQEAGVEPRTPIGVVAFSDEEGARFGVACVGSQLSTGALAPERALGLRDADGRTLAEVLTAAGRDPGSVGRDRRLRDRVGVFVELHVEQGRALDLLDRPLAVASSIWPHGRWRLSFTGQANHAGATRMVDRRDPMLAYAASVASARSRAVQHGCVATFGKLSVLPNGANAIASSVESWLDARAGSPNELDLLTREIFTDAAEHAEAEGVRLQVSAESESPIVEFPHAVRDRIVRALTAFGDVPVLATAAGHDAGVLSTVVPSAMVFVRNPTGVSHAPDEHAEPSDCHLGVAALAALMKEWAAV